MLNFLSEFPWVPSIIFGVVGIASAIIFGIRFHRAQKELKNSLSTRYIGTFPDILGAITELVIKAASYIYVLWDAADPGSYVQPEAHVRLLHAIEEAAHRGVNVTFLVWGDPQAITNAAEQRDKKLQARMVRNFCKLARGEAGFLAKLPYLFANRYPEPGVVNVESVKMFLAPSANVSALVNSQDGRAQFEALQLCYHDWIVERLQDNRVHVVRNKNKSGEPPPPENFFWIVDDKAGFAFVCPGKNAPALSTTDDRLVAALKEMFEERIKTITQRNELLTIQLNATR